MVKITITKSDGSTQTIDATESLDPSNYLFGFVAQRVDWKIDYKQLSPEEMDKWPIVDLSARCYRAIKYRGLPVIIDGTPYYDYKDLDKAMPTGRDLRIEMDDEGVGVVVSLGRYMN